MNKISSKYKKILIAIFFTAVPATVVLLISIINSNKQYDNYFIGEYNNKTYFSQVEIKDNKRLSLDYMEIYTYDENGNIGDIDELSKISETHYLDIGLDFIDDETNIGQLYLELSDLFIIKNELVSIYVTNSNGSDTTSNSQLEAVVVSKFNLDTKETITEEYIFDEYDINKIPEGMNFYKHIYYTTSDDGLSLFAVFPSEYEYDKYKLFVFELNDEDIILTNEEVYSLDSIPYFEIYEKSLHYTLVKRDNDFNSITINVTNSVENNTFELKSLNNIVDYCVTEEYNYLFTVDSVDKTKLHLEAYNKTDNSQVFVEEIENDQVKCHQNVLYNININGNNTNSFSNTFNYTDIVINDESFLENDTNNFPNNYAQYNESSLNSTILRELNTKENVSIILFHENSLIIQNKTIDGTFINIISLESMNKTLNSTLMNKSSIGVLIYGNEFDIIKYNKPPIFR